MTLADLALLGYGAIFGFACGCAVTAAIATWRVGVFADLDDVSAADTDQ